MDTFLKGLLGIVVLALLFITAVCQNAKASDLHPIEVVKTDGAFNVSEKGSKILSYRHKPVSLDGKYTRADYVHPLYDLNSSIFTEDFPEDHRHHRGIFWAWHQIFVGDKRLGDSWSLINFSYDVSDVKIFNIDSKSKAIQAKVYWKSSLWTDGHGEEKPFVEENATIRVFAAEPGMRKIDFEIKLLALEKGVRIGGSNNARGYGGFSPRIKLSEYTEFTDPNGSVTPKGNAVDPAPWMDFSGRFGNDEKVSGLTVLCHKSTPGYPQPWILRSKRSMQNSVYPGRYPVGLSTEKPLALRYRLIIHNGDVNYADINKLSAEYNAEYTDQSTKCSGK
jgi:hypothetical protein